MKHLYSFLLSLFFLTTAMSQSSGYVVVKGYVKNTNGVAVANRAVNIIPDSISSNCALNHTRYTNANGFYADTLACTSPIYFVIVRTANCNNTYLTNYDSVPSNKIVESNFTICVANTTVCHASFYDTVAGFNVYFQSGTSTTSSGDSIKERYWSFGDGTSLGGNVVNPLHTYTVNSTYTVCLKITSWSGCKDSICKTVVINNVTATCAANFSFSGNARVVNFNSSASVASTPPDAIVRRKWVFGDGDTLGGNVISPTHTYAQNGSYSVCLYIYTQLGCTSVACKQINLADTSCHAAFSFNIPTSNPVMFFNASTSGNSTAVSTYSWNFGDSSATSTVVNPTHQFPGPGTYYVCLTIGTSTGCHSTQCEHVTISNTRSCHAYVGINSPAPFTAPAAVLFSSMQSYTAAGDSILQRFWSWGDGTSSVQANGNNITHTYASAGNYIVNLIILSAGGCRDTTHTTITVVNGTTTGCHAQYFDSVLGSSVYFFSGSSSVAASDSIKERNWDFGDYNNPNHTLGGNVVNPLHQYLYNGTFTVCLKITSWGGCKDSICKTVVVTGVQTSCVAYFLYTTTYLNAAFSSANSSAPTGDSIVHRYWSFGDGDSLSGNVVSPYHTYLHAGTYNVCLTIVTAGGCTKTLCKSVTVVNQCVNPSFTFTVSGNVVTFNSANISLPAGDSILIREWQFGDSTSSLNGNVVSPSHTYSHTGTYQVCLVISTASGCVTTVCHPVTIANVPTCQAMFKSVKLNAATYQFQSSGSMSATSGAIINRKWTFGDGTTLTGNVINPVKTYQLAGTYNVCLRIETSTGCVSEICQLVKIGDSVIVHVDSSKKVEIISINPNPATTQFTSIVWSKYSGVSAELAIIDLYGTKRWSVNRTLASGNNIVVVPTSTLLAGPYTFKVTTTYGISSKRFYKL